MPAGRGDVTAELRQIIQRIEARHRAASPPRRSASLESLVGGAAEDTEHGPLLVVRRRFPVHHQHGAQPLREACVATPGALTLLARAATSFPGGARLLYLDTETTGLAGGTGTYVFLVGVGFFDGDEFEVRQFFLRDLDEEPRLLAALDGLVRGFDGLVTYNGTGFDLPLLETRFVLARRRWPGESVHLDLLPPARRLWRDRLADCRLATVERHVLGFTREDDIPGALIPAAYFEWLRRRSPGRLPQVFEHNRHDVLSLAALLGWVGAAVERAPAPELDPFELAGLGGLWERDDPGRSEACYRMALDLGLAGPGRERLLGRLAWWEKRRTRWDEARALWEEVARSQRGFDPRPWEEIAKIHEHRRRDFSSARSVVEEALARGRTHGASERILALLDHRRSRLERRLAGRR
ncbi:MAG: ribonuclease H-like domain-containing protein [Candidatus Rokubacteria bacterium]|nr:ribonuclease H-like domain-containing protein [Candidatus Rokubacteria bacterium]